MKSLRLRWWYRFGRRRAQERLGAHPVETAESGRIVRLVMGHEEPRKHDGLPLHDHDQRYGWPMAVWPG